MPDHDVEGIRLVAEERRRQIEEEGFTSEHDEEHCFGELSGAAASYAAAASRQIAEDRKTADGLMPAQAWRWSNEWWKPSDDPVRNLAKAGALIAAEIDRIQRERAELARLRAQRGADDA